MKLLASDYDQTLKIDNQIDQETKDLISQFRKAGNLFAIVTGRTLRTIYDELIEFDIEFDFVIASNGAMIVDNKKNILYEKYIDKAIAEQLINFAQENYFPYFICSNGNQIYGKFDLDDPRSIAHKKRHINNIITKEQLLEGNMISMVVRGHDMEHLNKLKKLIDLNFDEYVSSYKNLWVLDVMAKNVSKANGIKEALKHFNADEVYVIGDDFNDIPMIEPFNGYCVENDLTEVKAVAINQYKDVKSLIKDLL